MRRAPLAAIACALLLSGCPVPLSVVLGDDCDDEMAATRRDLGEPQAIVSDRVDDWHIVVYTYPTLGLIRSFEWETYHDCTVRDRPITAQPPAEVAPDP